MWAQIINTVLGIWLMASPALLSYDRIGADNAHIVGPLVVTFAFVACWEVTHSVRKVNVLTGLWLLVAPWVLGYEYALPIVNDMAVGVLVIILAQVEGKIEARFGGGWKSLWA